MPAAPPAVRQRAAALCVEYCEKRRRRDGEPLVSPPVLDGLRVECGARGWRAVLSRSGPQVRDDSSVLERVILEQEAATMRASGAFKESHAGDVGPLGDGGRVWVHKGGGVCGPGYYEVRPAEVNKATVSEELQTEVGCGRKATASHEEAGQSPDRMAAAAKRAAAEAASREAARLRAEKALADAKAGKMAPPSPKPQPEPQPKRDPESKSNPTKPDPNPDSTSSPTQVRRKWSTEEEELLRDGVMRYGEGRWEDIRRRCGLADRTGGQLKDKWRNLVKEGKQAEAARATRVGTLDIETAD